MAKIDGPPAGVTRNKPITKELKRILNDAADALGIDTVHITSGGQPGTTGKRTGSTRHDGGRAADLQLVKAGKTLTFTDKNGGDVEAYVTAVAARGATGIGAGVGYMGNKTIHVGFGTSPADKAKLVWGAKGKSANAPAWLRAAAENGWQNPVAVGASGGSAPLETGRYVVVARGGLRLRNGPGLGFSVSKSLEAGTELSVVGFDGPDSEWARVDLENDGLVDGHVFATFLKSAGSDADSTEDSDEPGDDDD